MRPVLFEVFGFPVNSYGVSKAAAALVAGYLLAREFRRLGWNPDRAWSIVLTATVVGFVGGNAPEGGAVLTGTNRSPSVPTAPI